MRRYISARSVLLCALLAGLAVDRADASTCERWQNDLDPCELLSASICSNPGSWTPGQWMYVNTWIYNNDTPEQACDKYWQKHEPDLYDGVSGIKATALPKTFECYMDGDVDGMLEIDGDDKNYYTQVEQVSVTRDTCCDLHPKGPYSSLGSLGRPGADFTPSLVANVKATNASRNGGTMRSDAKNVSATYPSGDQVFALGIDPYDFLTGSSYGNTAQVDHIIPQKDSKGCACGANTASNALVVSGQINRTMSNSCSNPDRITILNNYAHP